MRGLNTAKTLRLTLAALLLGMGIVLLIAGGTDRLKEHRRNKPDARVHVIVPQGAELKWRSGVLIHGSACSTAWRHGA